MTGEIRAWVAEMTALLGQGKTLEVGAFDVNGNVRDLFDDYIGVDMREGPNVDLVVNGHELAEHFAPASFDAVLWLEGLEHDDAFWLTKQGIDHVLKPGGYVIVSSPGNGFFEHGYPNDYWRVMPDGLAVLFTGYSGIDRRHLPRENTEAYCGRKP